MRKKIKMLNIIIVLVMLLSTILPVMGEFSKVFAETYSITYNRKSKLWRLNSRKF